MVRRFLVYSLDQGRPVKALFADTMKYRNIRVQALEGENVTYLLSGRKTPMTAPISDILSASYARGDDGDTLQDVHKEEDPHGKTDGKCEDAPER